MTTVNFRYHGATAQITLWDDKVASFHSLYSKERNLGHAHNVMQMVAEYADKNGLKLVLTVQQFGQPLYNAYNNHELQRFYEKFGFEKVPNSGYPIMMARESQKKQGP